MAPAIPSYRLRSSKKSDTALRIRWVADCISISTGSTTAGSPPDVCSMRFFAGSDNARTTCQCAVRTSGLRSLVSCCVQYLACRAINSARSANRPNQNKCSATRLGRSIADLFNSTDCRFPLSNVVGLTGPSLNTHTSLLSVPEARLSSSSFSS